uniref:26S proteasome non-ATPase regulatory subunit 4 n=1 Tax=Oncorhynchus tshawytscha TaxID=74940 RepID=A0AAZ3Q3Q6_ONCTS
MGKSSPREPSWCHTFAPANTSDSNNQLIMISKSAVGMGGKGVTTLAHEDWSCPSLAYMLHCVTYVCTVLSVRLSVDNSEYMRNGDFLPTRLQAQQDAVNIVCHSKTRSNPENNVGLITMANNCEVLTTLTADAGRILSKLHAVQPRGNISFCTGIRVAHVCILHNNTLQLIVCHDTEPCEVNTEKLTAFINTLNGKEGAGSHLVTVPPGPSLADALLSSPILAGEGGAMLGLGSSDFEFGVDPSADPELALALRVSMEEQRQRQEDETRRAAVVSATEAGVPSPTADESDEALLKMSVPQADTATPAMPDFSRMTEDEQIAYALQMSMQGGEFGAESMDMDTGAPVDSEGAKDEEDYDVMQDPEFLQSVLENLPGVDPNNEAIRNAMGSLASQTGSKPDSKKDKDDDKKK